MNNAVTVRSLPAWLMSRPAIFSLAIAGSLSLLTILYQMSRRSSKRNRDKEVPVLPVLTWLDFWRMIRSKGDIISIYNNYFRRYLETYGLVRVFIHNRILIR